MVYLKKREKVALRLATVKKGASFMSDPCLYRPNSFFLIIGVDQTRATLVSEPVESEETSLTLNMPMDIADGTFLNPSSKAIEFGNVITNA